MLDFFRRYQRYFFLVITFVVIISFSFFGTYSTIGSNTWRDQIAFKAVDGHDVSRSDLDEMTLFLATDSSDKQYYNGIWGPNFLNDGVIRKDFMETGMAQELACYYRDQLANDLQRRLDKEKKYTLYSHPQARFLNVENAWNYFMPEMAANYSALRSTKEANSPQAFDARVKLYLAEKKFPGASLKQVLRFQERQYGWLTPDPSLDRIDLSLFNYHTIEDWFGPRFTRLISEFIINTAIIAESKGYHVSRAEVLADLMRNSEISYQQNKNSPYLGVRSSAEYFNEQLRQLNIDQTRAVKIWRQVLLFRRYFQDVGHAALVDTLNYQNFQDFAKEAVEVDVYRLSPEFRFGDHDSLQRFEVYLNAVAKRPKDDILALPTQFLSYAEVAKTNPELVQKRYLLEIARVSKKNFYPRISLRETWNWEVEDDNWAILRKEFPDLGVSPAETRQERLAALDALDKATRAKVDSFARSSIVDSHPEWLQRAIDEAPSNQEVVGVRLQGGQLPFTGVNSKEQRQELINLLDKAPLNAPADKLQFYTADKQNYYRIKVIERSSQPEVLTFAEAIQDDTLDQIRDRLLEKYYLSIREKNPVLYQKPSDKSWKNFAEVKDLIAEQYFEKIFKALELAHEKNKAELTKDQAATLRFYNYVQQAKAKLENDPSQAKQLVRESEEENGNSWRKRDELANQWRLIKAEESWDRSKANPAMNAAHAFHLDNQKWSEVNKSVNGDLTFFRVREKGQPSKNVEKEIAERTKQAYALLSADAQRMLLHQVMKEILAKNAISLDFLNKTEDKSEEEESVAPPINPQDYQF